MLEPAALGVAAGTYPAGPHRSADGAQQLPTGALALAACLGAHGAVLVHAGVLLALVTARPARGDTCLEMGACEVCVVSGVARQDPRRHRAAVSAVGLVARSTLGQLAQ
jgi:hypothetical protein